MLAVTDFKLRFFGSALGYVWTLMRPLLLFGVLYFVFTEVVRFGGDIKHYPVYLLTSIVLFTYFSETTSRGVTSLVERENLLRKMRFPRLVIPLSVALHALFNLGLNMIVVFVFVLGSGIEPRAELAASCCRCSRCSWSSRPGWRCCCPRSTCATATCSRSGRWRCRSSSTRRP